MKLTLLVVASVGIATCVQAATVSPLFARGYTALPAPQKVTLGHNDFEFTSAWRLELAPQVPPDDVAVSELRDLMRERFHIAFTASKGSANTVRLAIQPNAVKPENVVEKDAAVLAEQAYRLTLASDRITVTGNTATGLYYGVETLVQLLKQRAGKLWLPEAEIEDWPDLEMRIMYWDDAHHLEHLDVLKAALRQASFYKINGFAIKLEGHFQYEHAKPIVEPYALSPAEFQELTDYGLKHHVQLIPYLDGPAHVAFILKHPEYAALREYPDSNYEFCATNPQTYELLNGMFDDLLAANKGVNYFVLSTDEPYYLGLAKNSQCQEADRAKELGSVGKLFAEFVTKAAGHLHDRGRKILFWGEYPLKPDDIASLPSYMINGEVYGPEFDPVFRAHGIRQMIYTSTEGEEQLFPQYYILPSSQRLHPGSARSGRVEEMIAGITLTSRVALSSMRRDAARANQADLMGVFIAGWADPGLHPETFWLGYATGPAAGWNRAAANPEEMQNAFYSLFYGPDVAGMGRLYQLMSEGAQFWEDSWERGPSSARKPIWGNSYGVFDPPRPAHDDYLPPLPIPSPEYLRLGADWRSQNAQRLQLAGNALAHNAELLDLLNANTERANFNRYNLEVYLSIAKLYRQNLTMLQDLGTISDSLKEAETAAAKVQARDAVEALDRALDTAEAIRLSRNRALEDATSTWYKSWHPRVAEANGRTYLDAVDDVKDHQPMRTVDMSYLVYRQLLYPMGDWLQKVAAVRNQYAAAHGLSERTQQVQWKETASGSPAAP